LLSTTVLSGTVAIPSGMCAKLRTVAAKQQ